MRQAQRPVCKLAPIGPRAAVHAERLGPRSRTTSPGGQLAENPPASSMDPDPSRRCPAGISVEPAPSQADGAAIGPTPSHQSHFVYDVLAFGAPAALPCASQALSRFTVLDLTRVRFEPTCVRQLAD